MAKRYHVGETVRRVTTDGSAGVIGVIRCISHTNRLLIYAVEDPEPPHIWLWSYARELARQDATEE